VLGAVPLLEAQLAAGEALPELASATLLNPDYELATFVNDTGPRLRRLFPIVSIYGDPADQALLLAEVANGATALLNKTKWSSRAAAAAWGRLLRAMGRGPVGGPHGPGGEEVELTADVGPSGTRGAAGRRNGGAAAGPVGEGRERRSEKAEETPGEAEEAAAVAAEAPEEVAAGPTDEAEASDTPAEAKAPAQGATGRSNDSVKALASWWRRSASERTTRDRRGGGDVEAGDDVDAGTERRRSAFASGRWRSSLGRLMGSGDGVAAAGDGDGDDAASAWRRAAAAMALMADEAARLTGLAPVVDWWTARPKRAGASKVLIAPTSGDLAHGMWRSKLDSPRRGATAAGISSGVGAVAAAAAVRGGSRAPAAPSKKLDRLSDSYLSLGRR
jgi:hypothetical protein